MTRRHRRAWQPLESLEHLERREMLSVAPLAVRRTSAGGGVGYVAAIMSAYSQTPTPIAQLTGTGQSLVQWLSLIADNADSDVATLTCHGKLPPNLAGYQASIDWGDGTVTPGVLFTDAAQTIHVRGHHYYSDAGQYTIRVTVTQGHRAGAPGAWSKSIISHADVNAGLPLLYDFEPSLRGETLHGIAGQPVHDVLATSYYSVYAATIDWGDGTPLEPGTVEPLAQYMSIRIWPQPPTPQAVITGTHTYQNPGTYDVTIRVQMFGGVWVNEIINAADPVVVHATVIIDPVAG